MSFALDPDSICRLRPVGARITGRPGTRSPDSVLEDETGRYQAASGTTGGPRAAGGTVSSLRSTLGSFAGSPGGGAQRIRPARRHHAVHGVTGSVQRPALPI